MEDVNPNIKRLLRNPDDAKCGMLRVACWDLQPGNDAMILWISFLFYHLAQSFTTPLARISRGFVGIFCGGNMS